MFWFRPEGRGVPTLVSGHFRLIGITTFAFFIFRMNNQGGIALHLLCERGTRREGGWR